MTMKSAARFSGKALAVVLAHLIAAQSATAAVQAVQVRTGALPVGAPAAVGSSAPGAAPRSRFREARPGRSGRPGSLREQDTARSAVRGRGHAGRGAGSRRLIQ